MIDIRSELMRNKEIPQVYRRVTRNLTVHWNGPAFKGTDFNQLKGDAKFHVQTRGWDGLSYHFGVGRDGTQYWCRDKAARLNHAGVAQGNSDSYAVLVLTGEGMPIPQAQLASLEQLILSLNIHPRYVLGHQEWPRLTACPGPLLLRWLTRYRNRFTAVGTATTIVNANIRDEASVLSHKQGEIPVNTPVHGTWILGKPYKGDSLWLQLASGDFVHASTLKGETPTWIQSL